MESGKAIVDSIHIFDDQNYLLHATIIQDKIYVVKQKEISNQYYFRIEKGKNFIPNTKYSFINRCEKSFELIHPSILNLSGFSVEKPYLYYKYISDWHKTYDTTLPYVKIQIIFLGIASGLSYLLKKGYYYEDFSISSVIFDKNFRPKLFDYINFDASNKNFENDLIPKYAELINNIINENKEENPEFIINPELQNLIERSKQTTNLPTFNEFIKFFKTKNYCSNTNLLEYGLFCKYLNILDYADKIIYDGNIYPENSIEQLSYSLCLEESFKWNVINDICYYNSLPEYCIKSLTNIYEPMTKFHKYLFYEDLSLIIPNWQTHLHMNSDKNPFKIYKLLKKKIAELENQRLKKIYLINERKGIENVIDALRIQAIYFLKKSYRKTNDPKVGIELALQYVAGNILPYNLEKSLNILKGIVRADEPTQNLINQMKTKIEKTIESSSLEKISKKLGNEQNEILRKANEEEDILSLLFCGFAFYTGFNAFPINHALSIQFYRKAAKKSVNAMTILGLLYYEGVIFPQNFNRAKNCFKRAAYGGDIKAEIIDCILRKHLWRMYLINFDLLYIISIYYLPSFRSAIPNDSLIIPKTINLNNKDKDRSYVTTLCRGDKELDSDKVDEIMNLNLGIDNITDDIPLLFYSQKKLLSSNFNEFTKERDQQMHYAKSFFYGDNGFPVDYSQAAKFFKLAADNPKSSDNGDSEAQWRYALMCNISLGVKNRFNDIEPYFQKSTKQNNLRGKLLYALYLRDRGDNYIFEQLIQECCDAGDPDAMYYYALHLEEIDKSLDQSMYYYQKAVNKGHYYSFIRLIYILKHRSQTELYRSNLAFSVALMNEHLLVKLISLYDKMKVYDQSNILIQIGLKLNYKLFNSFYADHLLYGKGMKPDEKRAEKFVILAKNDKYHPIYWERYIYIMLEIYIRRDQHQKAAEFLLCHGKCLTEKFRRKFILFYRKFDKIVANRNLITINYCYNDYRKCQDEMLRLKKEEKVNLPKVLSEIRRYAFDFDNPYAYVILGRMYKQGKHVPRDLKKAVQFFARAANLKCQEGYYYLGKEYFYGRILNQDYDLAKKYFLLAIKKYGEPRAGYFIYKIPGIRDDENIDDVEFLKISAFFGYKRALYTYGHRLIKKKDDRIETNIKAGKEYIKQAALQNYKKAKRFCKLEGFHHYKNEENDNDDDDNDDSQDLFSKFGKNKIELKISINEDELSSDIDSETDDENIAKFINVIKDRKKSQKEDNNNNDDENKENTNDDDREKIFDLIATLEEKKRNTPQIDTKEEEKSSKSLNDKKDEENVYVSNLFMDINIDEPISDSNNDKNEKISNLSVSLKNIKGSSKIEASEDENSYEIDNDKILKISGLLKDKKSSKKIIDKEDKMSSGSSIFKKDKKSSNKISTEDDEKVSVKDDDNKCSKFGSFRKDKKISANDDDNESSKFSSLKKDKKSSNKISTENDDKISANDENESSKFSSFRKGKKISTNDDDNESSKFSSFRKGKKSSNKISTNEDEKISINDADEDKKSSKLDSSKKDKNKYEINTDSDDDDISDLIAFWI